MLTKTYTAEILRSVEGVATITGSRCIEVPFWVSAYSAWEMMGADVSFGLVNFRRVK